MSRSKVTDETISIAAEIEESTPERCKPCHRSESIAMQLAISVVNGNVTLTEAKNTQTTEFRDCRYGYLNNDSALAAESCKIGIICVLGAENSIVE